MTEWTNGVPACYAEGRAGAAQFASGKGRHGSFGDLYGEGLDPLT